MSIGSLVGVVLGAVLAMGTGLATELWKQRRARRAAARLVWLELRTAHVRLLGAIALEKWPPDLAFSDKAWKTQRGELALAWSADKFQDLEQIYLALSHLFQQPPDRRANPVLFWKFFERVNAALISLGKVARLDSAVLNKITVPPLDQVKQLRSKVGQMATPQDMDKSVNEGVKRLLDAFPPELRDSARKALAKVQSSSQDKELFLKL
ncbi:hypothetical protein [Streptomyces sp. NPDC056683]|uniref:hypothetical protein n=1 Tax=Streptomyces sp. NPDC056683 TaxID=3345910 RepID=UPI003684D56D